ncbi:MAG: hypothetical protein OXI24_01590 [Candidatus Poribacteria bacterium]|nr:hypothetical protein [Candidatus Poribacteria bacterium]
MFINKGSFLIASLRSALLIIMVTFIVTEGSFLPEMADATWDRASSHIVTVDVYDLNGDYCHTYGYSYYIPDTNTQHLYEYTTL